MPVQSRILKLLVLRIEVDRMARAKGDVAKVTMHARMMRLRRRHRHIPRISRADRAEPAYETVDFLRLRRVCRDGNHLARAAFVFLVGKEALASNVHPFRPEEAVPTVPTLRFLERS